uniref:Uncharacterized protein n=1 Tax=viral metagenome TaxID=1070528 RepID=A0A6M3JXP9_9ZZZZ
MKVTPIIAILCITALEVVAITQGVNGATFGLVVAAIAGLGGWEAKVLRDKIKGGK